MVFGLELNAHTNQKNNAAPHMGCRLHGSVYKPNGNKGEVYS
jgi:hypothetical protein